MTAARVVIVGCGRMGAVRAAAAEQVGARVTALVDAVPETAESLARLHPGSRVIPGTAAIDWDEFDAAFVCTPPGARGAELDAVRAGVPVLLEKPLGLSAEAGRALADEALAQGGRRCGIFASDCDAGHRRSRSRAIGSWGPTRSRGGRTPRRPADR